VDWFQLVRVLTELIRFNTPLENAYGIECFLREAHNQYYLVDNILLPNEQQQLGWYTHHPTIVETYSLKTLLRRKGFNIYLQRIEELRSSDTPSELLASLPGRLQEVYRSEQQRRRQAGVRTEEEIFRSAQARGIPYYGTLDQRDVFRVVDIRGADQLTDVRTLKSGTVCLEAGMNKDRLVEVYFALGIHTEVKLSEEVASIPDPLVVLQQVKYGPKILQSPEVGLERWSDEAYTRALYVILQILKMSKKETCQILQEWMRSHDLLALILSDVKGVRKTKLKGIRGA
jgi:hypothetical protein